MRPGNQTTDTLDARYRVMLILWFVLYAALGLYYFLSLRLEGPTEIDSQSRFLTVLFTAMGTVLAVMSVVVKQKYFAKAVEKQEVRLVQTGFIIAMALCETAGLLGLMDLILTGNSVYYLLFIIAAIAMLFHFPRREPISAASYKSSDSGMENQG